MHCVKFIGLWKQRITSSIEKKEALTEGKSMLLLNGLHLNKMKVELFGFGFIFSVHPHNQKTF